MAGPLKVYDVTVNGFATRMKLTAADAERLGGVPVGAKARVAVPDKARRPRQQRPKADVETKTVKPEAEGDQSGT